MKMKHKYEPVIIISVDPKLMSMNRERKAKLASFLPL